MSKAPLPLPPAAPAMPPRSRYHHTEIGTRRDASGEELRYLKRRFIARAAADDDARRVEVPHDVRADQLAHALLRDAEAWWRIADANAAEHPEELEAPGHVLAVPGAPA